MASAEKARHRDKSLHAYTCDLDGEQQTALLTQRCFAHGAHRVHRERRRRKSKEEEWLCRGTAGMIFQSLESKLAC